MTTSDNIFANFWQHLEEIRVRLFRCVVCFLGCFVVCFDKMDRIIPFIVQPAQKLYFTSPSDAFSVNVTLAIVAAGIISAPYILYHLWAFVGGALKGPEKRFIYIFGPISLVFFLAGVAFAFWIAIPMSYGFLMSFSSNYLVPMVTVDKYFKFLGQMLLAFGVAFELPLIMAFFASIGIATPGYLAHKRRHAILIIFVVAAIFTPPDVGSQLTLAIPLILLYELGIIFVRIAYRGKPY